MIKSLATCIREYKKDTILAPVYVALEVVMDVVIPLLMANLIDFGIDAGDMNYVLKIGTALIISVIISTFMGVMSGKSAAMASSGFARNLRHDLFSRVQEFSFSNIDKFSTAGIVTRLTTDISNIQNAFQMLIRIAVRAPIMLVFSLCMSFAVNSSVALAFLAVMPVLSIALYFIIRKAHPIFERVFTTYDKLNTVVQENLRGIRVVKTFVREDFEAKKFGDVSQEIFKDFSLAEKLVALNSPIMQICLYACMLLISWIGARMIVGGSMSTGQLVTLFSYAMQILMSLMMISMLMIMIIISRASAERVSEILNEKINLENPDNPVSVVSDGSVRFENVSLSYSADPKNVCLSNISFSIKSGETIGIIGSTGSGKSSLISLISRLYDTTIGNVYVGSVNVRDYDMEVLRSTVSVVLQKNELFSGTIKENLLWGNRNADKNEIRRVCRLACADEFIMSFPKGYDTYIEQGGTNISGGQKQRICIARALLKHPQILILDDSTSAVDTKTDAIIRKALKSEMPQTTKFIIAQRTASVMDADKIIVMDNGTVDAFGTHDELIKNNDIYKEVYYSQVKEAVGV